MDLEYIFESFRKLDTVWDRVEYLKNLQKLNLSYDINYDRLIEVWSSMAVVEEE